MNTLGEEIRSVVLANTPGLTVTVDERQVVYLGGEVTTWQEVVDVGHIAGGFAGVKGVVNDVLPKGMKPQMVDQQAAINQAEKKGVIDGADVVIIGAGITGSGIARELAKYDLDILVLEKCSDVSEGTTKANNGMIHSGYDSKPGSLKAELNVRGNAMYDAWQADLGFKMVRTGSFVAGFDAEDDDYLETYLKRGRENGVPGIAILSGDEAREIEPALNHEVRKVLWTPSAAYVEPYEVVEALLENAIANGARLRLDTEVLAFTKGDDGISEVVTNRGIIAAGCVINAAGVFADTVAELAGDRFYTIHPRRGSLVILDKKCYSCSNKAFIGTPPKNFTKGGGPTTTPEGNPLWGPSAIEVPDKDDTAVSRADIDFVMEKGIHLTENMGYKDIITFFSGVRAANYIEDFIIEASELVPNFIHVAAIQSPGLASAPAIAQRVEEIYLQLYPNTVKRMDYNPVRAEHKAFRDCTPAEQEALIAADPRHGHIICRCETITEAEIVAAIHGPLPARTVDAVKRRTRAGMGRCQGGFCGPRVVEIIARELGLSPLEVTKNGGGSRMLDSYSRKEAGA